MNDPSKLRGASSTGDDVIGLAPPDASDPLIEAFKKDVDRTLLIENLRKTVDQRARQMQDLVVSLKEIRGAAWRQKGRASLRGK